MRLRELKHCQQVCVLLIDVVNYQNYSAFVTDKNVECAAQMEEY